METTDDDECPHGLGMKISCVFCNGRARKEEKEEELREDEIARGFKLWSHHERH